MDCAELELELEAQGVREFGLKLSLIAGADSGRNWSLSCLGITLELVSKGMLRKVLR